MRGGRSLLSILCGALVLSPSSGAHATPAPTHDALLLPHLQTRPVEKPQEARAREDQAQPSPLRRAAAEPKAEPAARVASEVLAMAQAALDSADGSAVLAALKQLPAAGHSVTGDLERALQARLVALAERTCADEQQRFDTNPRYLSAGEALSFFWVHRDRLPTPVARHITELYSAHAVRELMILLRDGERAMNTLRRIERVLRVGQTVPRAKIDAALAELQDIAGALQISGLGTHLRPGFREHLDPEQLPALERGVRLAGQDAIALWTKLTRFGQRHPEFASSPAVREARRGLSQCALR